jgi:hypothetical protein
MEEPVKAIVTEYLDVQEELLRLAHIFIPMAVAEDHMADLAQ